MNWLIVEETTQINEENLIITENETIKIVSDTLLENGHTIKSLALSHQRGIDLLTMKNNINYIYEFKGTKTHLHNDNIFSSGQNEIHFAEVLGQTLRRQSFIGAGSYNIVFPFHKDFINIIKQLGVFIHRLPVNIIIVGRQTIYEIHNPLSEVI